MGARTASASTIRTENKARPASQWRRGPRAAAAGRRSETSVSVIAHEQPSVAEGEGHADYEQRHADGGAEADAHAGNAEIVEEGHHRVGCLEGAAAGQRHDNVK